MKNELLGLDLHFKELYNSVILCPPKMPGSGQSAEADQTELWGKFAEMPSGSRWTPLSHLFAILARNKFLETSRGQLQLPPKRHVQYVNRSQDDKGE